MFNGLIRLALRYRPLVILLSLAMLLGGTYLATVMPIDVLPDLDRPRVVLLTESHGLAAEEVETLVTIPLETAMLGAAGVQAVRSNSAAGLSVVYVEFDWDVEIFRARQIVQERLATLTGVLPEGITPRMTPTTSIMGQIVIAGIYPRAGPKGGRLTPVGDSKFLAEKVGDDRAIVWEMVDRDNPATWKRVPIQDEEWSPREGEPLKGRVRIDGAWHEVEFQTEQRQWMDTRTLADWVIRRRLLKVPGVAEVFVMGGIRKQYQVLVDPLALTEYKVSLQQVEEALKANNLNATGGFSIEGDKERSIRVLGRLGPDPKKVLEQIRKIPIETHPKRNITIEQVATVTEGETLKRGDASIDGYPGVALTIVKQPHVDTRSLTDGIVKALDEAEASIPGHLVVNSELFQMKKFIDRGIFNVGEALVIGGVLVIIILFLFLLNFRTTFITLTAIPLSLAVTVGVFRLVGWLTGTELSINIMTLGGIAVAMGELVDDAIVDVENIFRRLRENNLAENPEPALRVVYEASREVRSAIVFGTAMVILVFLPLFALSGIEGRLFVPLGIAYIVSILASLLVSLTVTPVLSYYLLPQSKATHRETDGFLLRSMKWIASGLIRLSMSATEILLVITWGLVALCVWILLQLGADFLPPFDEGSVQVNIALPVGSSLEASNNATKLADAKFRQMQKSDANPNGEILHFVRRTGRAEMDEHTEPVTNTEYILSINPESGKSREEIIATLLEELKDEIPGVDLEVEQPLSHLISHMLSGVTAQIAIKVYGDDLTTLRQTAERIKTAITPVEGLTDPVIEPVRQADELHIRLRPDDLEFYGVTREYVAKFVETALQGEVVSEVIEGQRRFDLLVRLEDKARTDYTNLGRLRVLLPENRGEVLLSQLADVGDGAGPNLINREDGRRRIVIRCNALGRDLAGVVGDVQKRIREDVELPEGYFVEYGGQFESQQRATLRIALLASVAVVGMFVVLMMLYPSVQISLQILNAIPTAFIGGVLALAITGQSLTVASMVGFISLGGIAVRNGILLVTHYFHLMREEGEGFTESMILRGSLERLAPVLMTALTAGIGLAPLVIGGQQPGREILYPVATVILGGLVTSTLCEFLIHPGLFWRFSGQDAERIASQPEEGLASLGS